MNTEQSTRRGRNGHLLPGLVIVTVLLVAGCAGNAPLPAKTDAGAAAPVPVASGAVAISGNQVGQQVNRIAHSLSRQKIMYRQGPGLRDCSGIFHRVLNGLRTQYGGMDGVTLPTAASHRTTRQLARWYFERGALQFTATPRTDDRHIAPGTVMFFGRPGTTAKDLNPKAMFGSRGIAHMGVVVDIKRDAAGRVTSYGLFHGRRTGKVAAITRYHKRDHARYPAYGNGSQPWVAYASIIPSVQP
jgi:hypothetical protein